MTFLNDYVLFTGLPWARMAKNLPAVWETWVQFLDLKDPLDKRMATHPLQYSCLENSMDRGACSLQIAENRTRLSDRTITTA